LTVRNSQTVTAQVGWVITSVGAGGSVAVGGHVFEVAGGTKSSSKKINLVKMS
jgi:hypothetical protein